MIRPRGRKRGSGNFDLDRSKLRFASLRPSLSTRQDWKPRTKTRQCCADIRSHRATKRVIFQAWVRGESAGTKSSSTAEARRTNSKGDPRMPAPSMPIKVRTTQLAPSWKSVSSLEGTRWISTCSPNLSSIIYQWTNTHCKLKEKFGQIVDFEFLTEMGSLGTN